MIAIPVTILALAAGVYLLMQTKQLGLPALYKNLSWLVIILSLICMTCCVTRGVMHMRHMRQCEASDQCGMSHMRGGCMYMMNGHCGMGGGSCCGMSGGMGHMDCGMGGGSCSGMSGGMGHMECCGQAGSAMCTDSTGAGHESCMKKCESGKAACCQKSMAASADSAAKK